MFHLNPNTGDPLPCAKADTCPYAPHYPTREEVRAYYESLMETRTYPAPKRKTTAPPRRRPRPAMPVALPAVNDLNNAFADFKSSPEATAPPLPRGDWRAALAHKAEVNGDAYADATPDTSFVSAYYDATEDQAEEAWGFTEEFAG